MAGGEEGGGGRIYWAFAEVFLGLVVGHFCDLAAGLRGPGWVRWGSLNRCRVLGAYG